MIRGVIADTPTVFTSGQSVFTCYLSGASRLPYVQGFVYEALCLQPYLTEEENQLIELR